ncbi:MAG TPA: hypothetical protein VFP84_37470 [Kofleriaceae bacterium]|nr:hypothetical protein [Kofleriaceae bacterium]
MRAVAVMLAASLFAAACGTDSYLIPSGELARLAHTPPERRGQHVRVVQEVIETDVPSAPPVGPQTQVVVVPYVEIDGSVRTTSRGPHPAGHGGFGRFGHISGKGSDGKSAAIAVLVFAATALLTAAVIEGTRFDGYAELHPMHPVHLIGKDGELDVLPLAWLDDATLAWTDKAVIRASEGPWHPLERAPLDRRGLTYAMFGGVGSLRSAAGDLALGPAWTVQLGGYPTQELGIVASVFFGWRDNRYNATLFETRTTAEVQYLPVQLGLLHGGLYGGVGVAHRFEDAIRLADDRVIAGDETSLALDGGAMLQLDINTRIALTGRLGIAYAHGEQMHNALIGFSVF